MEFDVVIVGGGPAGLAAAIRLTQMANEAGKELLVALVEKGSEIGAHILSGAVIETGALDELLPDWREAGSPVNTAVNKDRFHLMLGEKNSVSIPGLFIPSPMHNHGNYIVSLGALCQWLGTLAEELGVNIFPGFPASQVIYGDQGEVQGVITGDMGVAADGEPKGTFEPGYELRARYTIFAEGCRGHLGKQLEQQFDLRSDCDPQHYGIGLKELWTVDPEKHQPGLVVHSLGWPLDLHTEGGGFLYHMGENQVALGFVVALNYKNPHLSPFDEFQRWKHHPAIRQYLEGGQRIGYGARALNKGGLQSLPKLSFPGGVLVGCEAGFLNPVKIKGIHTALKTGMLAAETIFASLAEGDEGGQDLIAYGDAVQASSVQDELYRARNFEPALKRYGTLIGAAFTWLDQNIFRGKLPFTWRCPIPDHEGLTPASEAACINYPKPDGVISFDRLSSVFVSSTHHEEDQPCHLELADPDIPISRNLPLYDEPAARYCPAGVYEVVEESGEKCFRISASNCVHCKTCDIKDPAQNITWVTPEGGGGPNYSNM
jgi:electron-transferring-flavoprotein dehydrogenase